MHLTGKVEVRPKGASRELAEQAVGYSGRVVNEVAVDDVDMTKADDRIEEQLGKMFEDRTEWDFDGKGVTFDSKKGWSRSPATSSRPQSRRRWNPCTSGRWREGCRQRSGSGRPEGVDEAQVAAWSGGPARRAPSPLRLREPFENTRRVLLTRRRRG